MKKLVIGTLALVFAAPALAETPSFNRITGGWQNLELDAGSFDVDGDGPFIGGSFEIGDSWHLTGSYSSADFDGIDLNQLQAGFGYHTAISQNTAFYADLLWVRLEADAGSFGSADESGPGVTVGLRSNVTESVELEGNIEYVDLDDGGDGTRLNGAAWYRFTEAFSVGIQASFEDDATGYGIGGRYFFGD